ncbi:unnamed protein product [Rotaria sordida]|uniref:Uncharacterized protein n=1 Tax=Rotaria sordida TaxID=392033 RepID=A0A815QMM1_9BILA|nr:unnamed protein product [Rotaria sordida]CAF1643362.1 unnamed protein product [Rotaria sordida]
MDAFLTPNYDSYPVVCSCSCSSSLFDGELLDNKLGRTCSTSTRTMDKFLSLDYYSRNHSFVDSPLSVEDLREHFASTYILTIGHSLTEINKEERIIIAI